MSERNEETMEPRRKTSGAHESFRAQRKERNGGVGGVLEEKTLNDPQPSANPSGAKKTRKRLQHPGELPRTQPSAQAQNAARRAYERRIAPDERIQQKPSQKGNGQSQEDFMADDPENFYRTAPPVPPKTKMKASQEQQQEQQQQQQQQQQSRGSPNDGRESVQSRRTSNQGGNEKGHKKQLSQAEIEFYERLATPKHVTPRKSKQDRNSRPKTDRELARSAIYHGGAGTRSRAVELPFNDQWSKSKLEREEDIPMMDGPMDGRVMDGQGRMHDTMNGPMYGPPGMYIEDGPEQSNGHYDALSGFASMLGWDNRRQHQMEMEINSLRKKLWHSQRKNDELNFNLSELSRANDGLQGDLRKVQQKSFGQMSKSVWTPLEDRAIQDILEEIHHDLEEWADENCKETFAEIKEGLNDKQQSGLFELCGRVADVTQGDLSSQFQWWEERHLDPILLLTALVTFRMYDCVFNNHFLALGAVDEAHMDTMSDIYRELAKLDFKQAQVWRSQLMRILVGTPQSGGRFDGVSSKLDISTFVKRFCDDMLDDFKNYPEFAFLKTEMSADSREGLLGCWTKAGELFIQLQTQVAALQWTATDRLRSSVNPRFVESHRSQAFPKGRNDGKPISLIISPMVTFFGNEDGDRYEDWRAICKATVLVIEEEMESSEEEEEEEEANQTADEDAMDEDVAEDEGQDELLKSQAKLVDDSEIL